jgi:uncharacterized membrane protein
MDLYANRKQIQKIYNNSIYDNIKGNIYTELSELRIDNDCIKNVSSNIINKTITFELENGISDKKFSKLIDEIKNTVKSFIKKNISFDQNNEIEELIESGLCYDSYFINKEDGSKTIIIQL